VGPGLGSLTLGLLGAAAHVSAVEIDPRLAGLLPGTVAERLPDLVERLTVVEGDALRLPELPGPAPQTFQHGLGHVHGDHLGVRELAGQRHRPGTGARAQVDDPGARRRQRPDPGDHLAVVLAQHRGVEIEELGQKIVGVVVRVLVEWSWECERAMPTTVAPACAFGIRSCV